ncbi:MAG: aminopeptidase P family protein [Myxococcota bacterium]
MNAKEKLQKIRKLMAERNLQAYLVPGTDPHGSEYLPTIWKRRQWLSGFTGSAGDLVITSKKAGLWTDSRYFLQAKEQLADSGITLFKVGMPATPDSISWLRRQLGSGDKVGVDPSLHLYRELQSFRDKLNPEQIELINVYPNLVDMLREEPLELPDDPIEIRGDEFSGEGFQEKLQKLRTAMKEQGAQLLVVRKLDEIAWLFNIRSNDVLYNPVVIAYAVITPEDSYLYLSLKKVNDELLAYFGDRVKLLEYEKFKDDLPVLARNRKVWLDPNSTSGWMHQLTENSSKLIFERSPVVQLKAVKNATELKGMVNCHLRDGIALTKFLYWLDNNHDGVSEVGAARKLLEFRREQLFFKGQSFETISSFGPNGAIVHYTPQKDPEITFKPRGLYLVDSGGQYLDGTTDLTRTVCFGKPLPKEKHMFTTGLKGFIDLATLSFPRGTSGKQLDTVSRLPLWKKGLNYGHGTGHGVGSYLNVHEGPHAISYYRCQGDPLVPGMVTSIEPGFYAEDEFGIRIENLFYVVEDKDLSCGDNQFYRFENLSICPLDSKLVDPELLSDDQKLFFNNYQQMCYRKLSPYLNEAEKTWLRKITESI